MIQRATGVLDAVRDLAPLISARAAEMETERCLPQDLFELLKAAGVFRMLTPKSHGGDEIGLLASLEVLEALASADGSTGWTTMIGAESPQLLSLLPPSTYDALYAGGPDVTLGGSFAPVGQARVIDGGYVVSGRWPFASGCQRWDWLFANCSIVEGGQPRLNEQGEPVSRAMLVRPQQVEIEDTWKVLGLKATGSHHFTIRDVFVPEEHTFDIFFGRPCVGGVARYPIIDFCFHITSVAIGIAQAALDDVVEAAATRQRMSMREALARTPLVQYRLGHAETSLRAARSYLRAEAERVVRESSNGSEPEFLPLMARVYGNDAWVAQVCTAVVDTCHTVNGSAGIYESSPLQRRVRDIHTITHHAALNENAITRAGAALLGQPIARWF
jgi:alkylation response protein AidB-like acyl-CoA dehydrogenase